jgi:flagellar basal-body rod modification protein FlgD
MAGIDTSYRNTVQSSETAMSATTTAAKRSGFESFGQDQFLKLLVAQLQNQDPLNPVKNEDFIGQLATFSSLEQLITIKESVQKLASATVDASSTDGTKAP